MTALHLASFNGHEREVEFLLSLGEKDINSTDDRGTYPVILASLNGYGTIVQLLLEKGAEINAQGGEYGNALQAVSLGGHDKIVRLNVWMEVHGMNNLQIVSTTRIPMARRGENIW
ncbi:hypothetical protein N7530_011449 [Penicillium desertorum]|uniref:Uncharacterized protein n=1 Tax=Penicillium desertorum TaxID=1303715 RepID=A0A9W9WDE8_9EURO|nr:hypothetical protein N7530_011449 [Penicillium desertorum]